MALKELTEVAKMLRNLPANPRCGLGSRGSVKIRPRPDRRTEEEAHDLEQHRRRSFGPRESRLRWPSEKIEGDLQVSPQDSGLRRRIVRKRSYLAISLEHERDRPERYPGEIMGRIPQPHAPQSIRARYVGGSGMIITLVVCKSP